MLRLPVRLAASLTPRALPPVDGFLEPNNHVFIRGTVAIAILIELLRELLARNHVDAHFSAEKCKWKAARSTAHSSVDFRITLYLCPKGNWCVEFQKRHVSTPLHATDIMMRLG